MLRFLLGPIWQAALLYRARLEWHIRLTAWATPRGESTPGNAAPRPVGHAVKRANANCRGIHPPCEPTVLQRPASALPVVRRAVGFEYGNEHWLTAGRRWDGTEHSMTAVCQISIGTTDEELLEEKHPPRHP